MTLHTDINIQLGSSPDRQYLLDLTRSPKLGKNSHVVYIYSLVGESVGYPNKEGMVIYIGEAGRLTEPTGKRFGQHISTSACEGGDSGTIYALSRYYWQGKKLRLQITLLPNKEQRKQLERKLLNIHVKEYGALPICQGTTGENYKTSALASLHVTDDVATLLTLRSSGSGEKPPAPYLNVRNQLESLL